MATHSSATRTISSNDYSLIVTLAPELNLRVIFVHLAPFPKHGTGRPEGQDGLKFKLTHYRNLGHDYSQFILGQCVFRGDEEASSRAQ